LLRRPNDKTSLTGVWNPIDPWTLSVAISVDRGRFGLTPRLTAPGYTLVNVALEDKIDQLVTVCGRIDNLFRRA
jgi:vitamin B12 transporter